MILGGSKNFEVKQIAEGDKTSTTIVLLGENQILDPDQQDLLSEIVTEAGIATQSDLKDDAEYEELALEILNAETDPKIAKRRLKYDRKMRSEDNAFAKRSHEIEQQIEVLKRSHSEAQNEITELEIRLRSKEAKLTSIKNEIKKFSC